MKLASSVRAKCVRRLSGSVWRLARFGAWRALKLESEERRKARKGKKSESKRGELD